MTPHPSAISTPQALTFHFKAPGREESSVTATVQPGGDHVKTGQHLIFPDWPNDDFKGFPICQAKVSSPKSIGYAASYGWIQVWREAVPPNQNIIGVPWMMDDIAFGIDTPFAWYGPEPQLFDAPSREPSVKELDWSAVSILTYTEDAMRTKSVRPILAFEWGFWVREGERSVKPLEARSIDAAWEEQRGLLERNFPEWRFETLDDKVEAKYE